MNPTDADIEIEWDDLDITQNGGSNVLGWYIQINSGYGTDFDDTYIQLVLPADLKHTFSGLLQGVTWKIRVAAYNHIYEVNALGTSLNWSPVLTAITALAPGKVMDFAQKSTDYESDKVKLEWGDADANGSPIQNYILYKDNDFGVFYQLYKGLSHEYVDIDVQPGNSYTYKVAGENAIGESTIMDPLNGIAGAKPSAPTNLRIGTQSTSLLSIEFDPPVDDGDLLISYYVVNEMESTSLTVGSDKNTTSSNGHVMTVASEDEGKHFLFRVAAVNSLGKGDYTEDIILVATDPPSSPSLSLLSRGTDKFYLQFIAPSSDGGSPIIGFRLYRDEGVSGSPYSMLTDVYASQILYTSTGLIAGLTYSYKLSAYNSVHETLSSPIQYVAGTVPPNAADPIQYSSSKLFT
jgi:hypothetical protein